MDKCYKGCRYGDGFGCWCRLPADHDTPEDAMCYSMPFMLAELRAALEQVENRLSRLDEDDLWADKMLAWALKGAIWIA